MVFFFYDGPTPPEGVFGSKFLKITPSLDFVKTRSYPDLLNFNARGADKTGSRASFRVGLFKNSFTYHTPSEQSSRRLEVLIHTEILSGPPLEISQSQLFFHSTVSMI
jgi:hypothetical protein